MTQGSRSRRGVMALLTSRRLAVGLICAVTAALVVAVLDQPWVLTSVPFLGLVAVLAVSTGACAWERTRAALRVARVPGADAMLKRLAAPSAIRVPLPLDVEAEAAMAEVARRLRGRRMAVSERDGLVGARKGRAGLIGSPLFHWALALLLVTFAAGALLRSEGRIPLPMGEPRTLEPANYQVFKAGRLNASRSGLVLQADDLTLSYLVDGIDAGPTPAVTLSDGSGVLASGLVYPNHPLRWRTMMVHVVDHGLAPKLALEAADGALRGEVSGFSDFDPKSASGTTPSEFELTDRAGVARYSAHVEVLADKVTSPETGLVGVQPRMPTTPTVLIRVIALSGSGEATQTRLAVGEILRLRDGSGVRLVGVDYFARVSVVDDPSVHVIYALLGLSLVGLSLALLLPYRVVWVGVSGTGAHRELAAVVRHQRGAMGFKAAVERLLEEIAAR